MIPLKIKNRFFAAAIFSLSSIGNIGWAQTPPPPASVYVNSSWVSVDASTDPDGSGPATQLGYDAFDRIVPALAQVATGGTVHVAAGVYPEQLEISRNIILEGSGNDTIIESPEVLELSFNTGVDNKPIIWVHDTNNARILSLTVDGLGLGNDNQRFMGIAFQNAGGLIDQVTVRNIENTPMDGSQQGIGIYVRNLHAIDRSVAITRCTIHDYQKNGIAVVGEHLTATITDNVVTGAGPTPLLAQNGIQLSYGAAGTIQRNTVRANDCISEAGNCTLDPALTLDADTASGILIFSPGNALVDIGNNLLEDNQCNLCALSYSYFTSAALLNVSIHDNRIDEGEVGVGIFDPDGTVTVSSTMTQNHVEGQRYGLFVRDDTPGETMPSVTAHFNRFLQNASYGAWSNTALNAENNWWGCPTGSALTAGACDTHTSFVDTNPWLMTSDISGVPGSYFEFYLRRDFEQRTGDVWTVPVDIEWYANLAPIEFSSPDLSPASGITFSPASNPVSRPATGSSSRVNLTFRIAPGSPAPAYVTFLLRGQAGTIQADQMIEVMVSPGVGGSSGSGGVISTGGNSGSGGLVGSGGTGGSLGSGGSGGSGAGGSSGSGGISASGGTTATGGSSGSGGISGTGGAAAGTGGGVSGSGGAGAGGTAGAGTGATSGRGGIPAADPVTYSGTFPNSTLWYNANLTVSGLSRTLRVFRPNQNTNLPLILLFPGSGNSTSEIIDYMGGQDAIRARLALTGNAVVVAVPNRQNPADWDHSGNGLFFDTTNDNPDTNADLLLVRSVIKESIRAYGINPARVYTMGFSNGAFFAIHVAMTIPSRIAGFAERSGGWARCLQGGEKYDPPFVSRNTTCTSTSSTTSCTCALLLTEAASNAHYTCTNTVQQPISSLPTGVNRVPGYISHDPLDDSVSVYYSCDLYNQMSLNGFDVAPPDLRHLADMDGGRHGVPENFFNNAWDFLRAKTL